MRSLQNTALLWFESVCQLMSQHPKVERRAWTVSVLLSVAVISLIALSSRRLLPRSVVPDAPLWFLEAVPHINALLVLTGFVTVVLGYRSVKRGEVELHARYMAVTTVVFFSFLALYLLRITNLGLTEFPGTDFVYTYVYLPFLGVHMLLATICVPLVLYAVTVAATLDTSEIPETRHPDVGRIAAPLWAISFAFGFVVYLMVHRPTPFL